MRWEHPQRGFLAPSEFVPLAEESGMIHALTLWVLAASLRQQKAWRAKGLDIPVAVNMSRRMLQDPRLPEIIAHLLVQCDAAPSGLEARAPQRPRSVLSTLSRKIPPVAAY